MKYLVQTIIAGAVAYYLGTAINDAYLTLAGKVGTVRQGITDAQRIAP